LANELFDTGVNLSVEKSIVFLQMALNALNRNGQLYSDIAEDGAFGKNTLNTLNTYLKTDSAELIYKIMNILQGAHYIDGMRKNTIKEKYARGWLDRVEFVKN
jgi:lysozyme family protein